MLTSPRYTASTTILTSTWVTSVRTPIPATQSTWAHAYQPTWYGLSLRLPVFRPRRGPSHQCRPLDAILPDTHKAYRSNAPQPPWSQGLARGWPNGRPGPVGDAWRVGVGWCEGGRCGARRELLRERSCDGSQGAPSFFSAGGRSN
jgi:hypothetical protein